VSECGYLSPDISKFLSASGTVSLYTSHFFIFVPSVWIVLLKGILQGWIVKSYPNWRKIFRLWLPENRNNFSK